MQAPELFIILSSGPSTGPGPACKEFRSVTVMRFPLFVLTSGVQKVKSPPIQSSPVLNLRMCVCVYAL